MNEYDIASSSTILLIKRPANYFRDVKKKSLNGGGLLLQEKQSIPPISIFLNNFKLTNTIYRRFDEDIVNMLS